jgi:hypothetical protein
MKCLFGNAAQDGLIHCVKLKCNYSFYAFYQDFMRAMRISNPAMRAIADQMERDEVLRWSNSLTRARVTRWGGMISTPDDVLQVNHYLTIQLDPTQPNYT